MDELLASVFLNLILTIIAYMVFPLIRLWINHGKFEKKRAKKIALWNSIVVGAIFCIVTVSGDSGSTWNAAPAFLYYWINCVVLTDKNAPLESKQKANIENTSSNQTVTRHPQIQSKIQFCRKCGVNLEEDSRFCHKCGTEIKEEQQ